MEVKISKVAKKILAKYGKCEVGKSYEIDGKSYTLTDGDTTHLSRRVDDFIDKMKNKYTSNESQEISKKYNMNEREELNKLIHTYVDVNSREDYTDYKGLITALIEWKNEQLSAVPKENISEETKKHYRKEGYMSAFTSSEKFRKMALKQFDEMSDSDFFIPLDN